PGPHLTSAQAVTTYSATWEGLIHRRTLILARASAAEATSQVGILMGADGSDIDAATAPGPRTVLGSVRGWSGLARSQMKMSATVTVAWARMPRLRRGWACA